MNIKIHEDNRAFREFYPDPRMRHQVHYAYAYKFLPQYVHQNPSAFFARFRPETPGGAQDPTRFIQSNWNMFEERSGLVQSGGNIFKDGLAFRRVSDLTMSTLDVADRKVALVQMPAPEQMCEAFFVAVVLLASPAHPESWPDAQARIFTLEAALTQEEDRSGPPFELKTGFVGEWIKDGGRNNLGGIRAERDAFLRAVTAGLQAPHLTSTAEFTPPGEGVPAIITPRGGGNAPSPPQSQPPAETRKPWWKIW